MSHPDRLPAYRPPSLGNVVPFPSTPSKRLVRAEVATTEDVALHDLDTMRRLIKAEHEARANRELMQHVTEAEMSLYDELLPDAAGSAYKQHRLAQRLAVLTALNDDTIDRYRR